MNPIAIGQRLRALRGEKTQESVATDLGISVSAWTMYECGVRVPRDDLKVKIARYFNKTVGEIFFAEECHDM